MNPRDAHAAATAVLDAVEQAVVGKRDALELVFAGMLAGGHVLLEDVPGLGKTLMARSFAQVLGLDFRRVQFTPDLLPADITGSYVVDSSGEFVFRQGPIFTQLLLGDEVNRTPPKTQAALLESMQEHQVTVEGTTFALPEPFVVLATANPIEHEGTYPLPEAQLDRFMLRVSLGYPGVDDEWQVLVRRLRRQREDQVLAPVADAATFVAMQRAVESVAVEESVGRYCVLLVRATREHRTVMVGASPRGALALMQASRARALLRGRDYVVPEDVKAVAIPALAHRLVLEPETWLRRITPAHVLAEVLDLVAAPSSALAPDYADRP
ncbi:MAG: MoxR family ATPase [Sporichthyaceae bacterium]|nr:MoxR family ATPase [Sporichthyaceae bacterium]